MMNTEKCALAELLFPDVKNTPDYYFQKYPKRTAPAYRIAPSPTGYVHIGTVGLVVVNSYLAKQSGGVFYLRIEDTDDKRFVGDAVANMKSTFEDFNIKFDEGAFNGGKYGPYVQSERIEIYHTFAKWLVGQGRAYPCFCAERELTEIRERQEANKEKTGYYGAYAKCRALSFDEVKQRIAGGGKWVLRADFSQWTEQDRISWTDGAKGEMSLPCEINDPIILKSNGVPPYNLAHVVDDTLMGTTAVVRGEEWLVSAAQHIQLFDLLELPRLWYIHTPTISIEDNGKKRKLSKRKDREALAMNLLADGYPAGAVLEYLLTIYNTDFELWRLANPDKNIADFDFKVEKIGSNNPLFDIPKLNDISKNVLSKKSCGQITAEFDGWFAKFRPFDLNENEIARVRQMLCVERGIERPRKDLVKFGDIPALYDYMLDGFTAGRNWTEDERLILTEYGNNYNDVNDEKTVWFEKIKQMAQRYGYAVDKKDYKVQPDRYKGTVADFVQIIRAAITGKDSAPDLWSVCKILGKEIVRRRCNPRI
jgi:glutamyl-tRNA synthetase